MDIGTTTDATLVSVAAYTLRKDVAGVRFLDVAPEWKMI